MDTTMTTAATQQMFQQLAVVIRETSVALRGASGGQPINISLRPHLRRAQTARTRTR
eukprot:COSAG03_NODE_21236_length_307_cov_0.735577_1_plen_56_part_01